MVSPSGSLAQYIYIGISVTTLQIKKLKTKYEGYASFRVFGRSDNPDSLLDPNLWGEGIMVRWYRMKRVENVTNTVHASEHLEASESSAEKHYGFTCGIS